MMEVLTSWLGDGGKPVPTPLAQSRANVCKTCPLNCAGKWWESAKHIIADEIKRQLELKHDMRIGISDEDDLYMCKGCGCCLRLKIHVPIKHIVEHSSEETMNKYPAHCWIKTEQNL
jgi:hypothetical protein